MSNETVELLKLNNKKHLIFRLNRAIGQIEAIKKELLKNPDDQDCLKTFQQLKASINALKKFGEVYMTEHLDEWLNQEEYRIKRLKRKQKLELIQGSL